MNVIVVDTTSGLKVESRDTLFRDQDIWWWTEGNGSCDCNRAKMFPEEIDVEMDAKMRKDHPELKEHQSYCYGEERFVVIAVNPMPRGYNLDDFNDGYKRL